MFNKEQFIQDCKTAITDGQPAIREVVTKALSDRSGIISELGKPQHAGIFPLHQSSDLTIINFAWAPYMSLMPHNHQMFAVIGIYSGREDNILWRKTKSQTHNSIEAAGAQSLGVGDVATFGRDIIHSVSNPIAKMTCAIHVYGGDFFEPEEPRSGWDHETLVEKPWDVERVKKLFQEADTRSRIT